MFLRESTILGDNGVAEVEIFIHQEQVACRLLNGGPHTAMLASIASNVVFVMESADVSKPCLMGETILNEYSIQLAFKPQLSLFQLDLS